MTFYKDLTIVGNAGMQTERTKRSKPPLHSLLVYETLFLSLLQGTDKLIDYQSNIITRNAVCKV